MVMVRSQTLLDDQKHPEKCLGLEITLVSIAAYYVDLSKEVEDQIIARNELTCG